MSAEPYYADERLTLHHGDALDVLQGMCDESVDIVVTSPPFNMGLTPGGNGRGMYRHPTQKAGRFDDGYSAQGDDAMPPDEYAALRASELWEMWRIARLGVFYNHRPRVIHGVLVDPLEALTVHGGDLPPVRHRIILARPTGIDVGLTRFCTRGEYLYLFPKPAFRLVDRSASGMGDVWITPIPRKVLDPATGRKHPAPFDQSIPARCIAATGATSVLDPFMGTGTTAVAAWEAGARAVGVERSEDWCSFVAGRCDAWTPTATPPSTGAESRDDR